MRGLVLRQAAVARVEKEQTVQASLSGQLRNLQALEAEHLAAADVQRTAHSGAVHARNRLQRALNRSPQPATRPASLWRFACCASSLARRGVCTCPAVQLTSCMPCNSAHLLVVWPR